MKRVILDRDSESRNELMSRKEEFITPRYAEDKFVYAFFKDQKFYFITSISEEEYKIIPLVTGEIDTHRFKTLRGAVKHCIKKKVVLREFGSSKELSKWMMNLQGKTKDELIGNNI